MFLIRHHARLTASLRSRSSPWPTLLATFQPRCARWNSNDRLHGNSSSKASFSTSSSRASSDAASRSDPLRILFCGSDQFSCVSLRALHDELRKSASQSGGGLIRSIDVVVRPPKPTGRGYKVLKDVPLRSVAEELNLPIHMRDTFTGWDMPQPDNEHINLIIAVSFGLFVPPRLLSAAKYGGLNVHPSYLPDLRGPAPIHRALLLSRPSTGVTIQTLSPTTFDAGVPLMQTPHPGIPLPDLSATTPIPTTKPNESPSPSPSPSPPPFSPDQLQDLHTRLAQEGANLLLQTLHRGLHVPPHKSCLVTTAADGSSQEAEQARQKGDFSAYVHAPKISSFDKQLPLLPRTLLNENGAPTTAEGLSLARAAQVRYRVLGPLWSHFRKDGKPNWRTGKVTTTTKRLILEELEALDPSAYPSNMDALMQEKYVRWVLKFAGPAKPKEEKKEEEHQDKDDQTDQADQAVEREWMGRYIPAPGSKEVVLLELKDGSWLRVGKITIEGMTSKPARKVLDSIQASQDEVRQHGEEIIQDLFDQDIKKLKQKSGH
ncbi:hypothetical protein VTJ04DRAFT_8200 [Mycothermus thermophilus]|uniref:uncharacterized protein n=1 Tax=Humicola insolens TaxID=85995 RepID=UPI0037447460